MQEVAANCHEFADYANLIGMNSSCKMRWSGQWPGAQQSQLPTDLTQQTLAGTICTSDDLSVSSASAAAQQRSQSNQVMAIDHQLHQQIQQQLCVEQFQFISQLQVRNSQKNKR